MTTYNLTSTVDTHEVDPISRIEGHLGIKVALSGGVVVDANAHGNLWRGFENFLLGRKPNDPITFTQRICGVCPVPHGLTATYAADTVLGYSQGHITFKGVVSEKAMLIRNLVLASEFLMSSITHFYHLVAPSYVQGPAVPPWTPYFNNNYYSPLLRGTATGVNAALPGVVPDANPATLQLWDAVIISYVTALKMRRLTFEAGALFAGRMPMTSCYVAGGVTNDTSNAADFAARCAKFKELIRTVGLWILQEYVPIAFALGLLNVDFDNANNNGISPTNLTVHAGEGYGAGVGRFLAWGAFPQVDNTLFTKGGVKYAAGDGLTSFTVSNKTQVAAMWLNEQSDDYSVVNNLTEDIANSRYSISAADTAAGSYSGTAAYPGDVLRTKPARNNGYSYMKTPLWKGLPCEVGPLARLAVAGIYPTNGSALAPLYASIYTLSGGGVNPNALTPTLLAGLVNTDTSGVSAGTTAADLVLNWLVNLKGGLSTMDRIRARALESLLLVQKMVGNVAVDSGTGAISWAPTPVADADKPWIDQLASRGGQASWSVGSSAARKVGTWHGWGATEAPRGALMHQSTIKDNKIIAYQCIVPTTWNGAPKNSAGDNGPMEAAVIGVAWDNHTSTFTSQDGTTPVTAQGGVEVVRIAQSFDPCIACAVH